MPHDLIPHTYNLIPNKQTYLMKTYQQKGNNSLLILNHKTSKKVFINDVILLKGDVNYTILYLENGKQKVEHPEFQCIDTEWHNPLAVIYFASL
jgi:hypothetical protein